VILELVIEEFGPAAQTMLLQQLAARYRISFDRLRITEVVKGGTTIVTVLVLSDPSSPSPSGAAVANQIVSDYNNGSLRLTQDCARDHGAPPCLLLVTSASLDTSFASMNTPAPGNPSFGVGNNPPSVVASAAAADVAGLGVGAIVGIALGALAVVAIVVFLGLAFAKKDAARNMSRQPAASINASDKWSDLQGSQKTVGPTGEHVSVAELGIIVPAERPVPPVREIAAIPWDYELTTELAASGVNLGVRKHFAGAVYRPEGRRDDLNSDRVGSPPPPWGPSSRPYIAPPAPPVPASRPHLTGPRGQSTTALENDSDLLGAVEGNFMWA
jgi:hypothetical protein